MDSVLLPSCAMMFLFFSLWVIRWPGATFEALMFRVGNFFHSAGTWVFLCGAVAFVVEITDLVGK